MNPPRPPGQQPSEDTAERALRRMSRRSFMVAGIAALAGLGGWYWLRNTSEEDGIAWPLRRGLRWNERLAEGYFRDSRLAPAYSPGQAEEPRVNGQIGLHSELDAANWRLMVEIPSRNVSRDFRLEEIQALPRVEMTTELKCIEGWSTIVTWAGARFLDFAREHRLATRDGGDLREPKGLFPYVQMATPDGDYYVGLDMASALHPQTLLCYAMNGQPLTSGHGAPLRLVTTVKYGIKSIKRIGRIRFLDQRPADYWAEQGYDWYAGH